jgi:hypothetical protein
MDLSAISGGLVRSQKFQPSSSDGNEKVTTPDSTSNDDAMPANRRRTTLGSPQSNGDGSARPAGGIVGHRDHTRSKRSSAKGRASASASRHSTPRFAASVRKRPSSIIFGVRSVAVTFAPDFAAAIAKLPLPAATSSTFIPGWTATALASASACGSRNRASSR